MPHLPNSLNASRLLAVALSLLLLAALFPLLRVDAGELMTASARLGTVTLIAVLALSLVNYGLRYLRWHRFVQRQGVTVPHRRHLLVYLAGFALTTTPGKAGEGLRARFLKAHGLGYLACFGTLFAERLLDLLAIVLLASLMLTDHGASWVLVGGGILVFALLLLTCHPALPGVLQRRHTSGNRTARLCHSVAELLTASGRLLTPQTLLPALVIGLVAWAAEGWALQLLANDLGLSIATGPAIAIYAIAILAGALAMLPGGLGGTEAVMTLLLIDAGAEAPTALAITLLCRAATLWFSVLLGAVSWLALECGLFPDHV